MGILARLGSITTVRDRRTDVHSEGPARTSPVGAGWIAAWNRGQRLALAHLIERKIEVGELRDYAKAARLLGVTRARLSQLADLVLLPAGVQTAILEERMESVSERQVRLGSTAQG